MKKKIIKMVEDMLLHRRNGHINKEQASYGRLYSFCEKHNINFNDAVDGATRYLKTQKIAPMMNGLV
jgi:hypothetical protein